MYIRFPAVIVSLAGVIIALLTSSFAMLAGFEIALMLLCVIDALAAVSPRLLRVERSAPAATRVGEDIEPVLTITNTSKRAILAQLRDAWPPSAGAESNIFPMSISAGQSFTITERFIPTRRGTRRSEALTIRISGPLRLAGRQRSYLTTWDIRVLPAFTSRKHLPSRIQRLRELEGRALLLVRGQGTEFDSLREYVAGDDVRAIDWRSTARLGTTVVRTWRPERDRRVIIVSDAGRSGALRIQDAPAFDAYIETSLLMAALASKAGDNVHVMALDSRMRAHVIDGKGAPIINRLGEAFADVEPTLLATDWQLAATHIDKVTNQPALVIVLTTLGLSAISDGLIDAVSALARRHTVLVGSVQRARASMACAHTEHNTEHTEHNTKHNTEEAFQQAANARSELEVDTVATSLRRAGAYVVQTSADQLPPTIADTYIDLKAQGKL